MNKEPYPSYRKTDLPWLGQIPAHWDIAPLGNYSKMIVPMRDKPQDLEGDIPWIRIEDFNGKYISGSKSGQGVSSETIKVMNLRLFPVGTVLCSCSCNMGVTAIVSRPLISNQTFIGIFPQQSLDSDYVYYLMQVGQEHLNAIATGAIQQYLSRNVFQRLRVPIPPLFEQQVIATYLDQQTAKIDALIAKKQRLLELLAEQHTAIIGQAVTKGLNPNVQMKDSRVAWPGQVPSHWEILHLRRVINKFVDYRGHTPEKVDDGIPLITARNIKNGKIDWELSQEYIPIELYDEWMVRGFPEKGDVLVTMEAPLGETAQISETRIALAQRIILLKADKTKIENDYLKYFLASLAGQGELWSRATGSTAIGIKASHLKEIIVFVPPMDEQNEIVRIIRQEEVKIFALIPKIETAIERLREYRTALISSVVTGKVDVRRNL